MTISVASVDTLVAEERAGTMLRTGMIAFARYPKSIGKRGKSTGDLMKDCGWDKLVAKANCIKEAEMKDSKVEMRKRPESQTGLVVPKIPVDAECAIRCMKFIDGAPRAVVVASHVIIKRRPKLVTQQGTDNVGVWRLKFGVKERWENPCMGWSSSGYPMSNLNLYFNSSDDAAEFAQKRGWTFEVEDSDPPKKLKKHVHKSYAEIFSWNKRTRVSTK